MYVPDCVFLHCILSVRQFWYEFMVLEMTWIQSYTSVGVHCMMQHLASSCDAVYNSKWYLWVHDIILHLYEYAYCGINIVQFNSSLAKASWQFYCGSFHIPTTSYGCFMNCYLTLMSIFDSISNCLQCSQNSCRLCSA